MKKKRRTKKSLPYEQKVGYLPTLGGWKRIHITRHLSLHIFYEYGYGSDL